MRRGDDEAIAYTLCNEAMPASDGNDRPIPFTVDLPPAFCAFGLQRGNLALDPFVLLRKLLHPFQCLFTVGTVHSCLAAPANGWPVIK